MEGDIDVPHRRSSYLRGCVMSPSCFPVHEELEYTRIRCCTTATTPARSSRDSSSGNRRGRRWRNLLRRLVRDGKTSIYGSKPLSFHYDAVSYSQNFDEGCNYEEFRLHCPKVCRDREVGFSRVAVNL